MNDLRWSPPEKAAARKAFDLALTREFDDVTREVKRRAAGIKDRSALWELEDYLTTSRKEIDRKYDYRYSVLPMVFAYLIREGRLVNLFPDWPDERFPLYAYHPSRHNVPAKTRVFLDFIVALTSAS